VRVFGLSVAVVVEAQAAAARPARAANLFIMEVIWS